MGRSAWSRIAHGAVVPLAYLAMSVAMTWPLAARIDDHVLEAKYFWDAYTNTMLITARVRGALGIGAGDVYDNYFFAPIDDTIAFNENHFGLALLFAPFYFATGQPLFAYNLTLLLSLTLSGTFMFVLVRGLTGSAPAAFLSGLAFAFCPYAMYEIGRIQLVATQWIPLMLIFLHRAIEGGRLRDALALAAAYALQVGTCLYYAMFVLPLLAFLGAWLLVRHRPHVPGLWLRLGAAAIACGATVLAMVRPYFSSRRNFDLTRTEEFAQSFDGKFSFLLNVHPTNKLLGFLHHVPVTEDGAHEEIAFPGFTIAALALFAFGGAVVKALGQAPEARARRVGLAAALVVAGSGLGYAATLYADSLLAAVLPVAVSALIWHRVGRGSAAPLSPVTPYAWALILSVVLFLGIEPFVDDGRSVRGLYYYLYTYVPGFDGIRKVSRQAIVVMFAFSVLAGFGAAALFARLAQARVRGAVLAALVVLVSLEFLSAPHALAAVPAGRATPKAYGWIAARPGRAPVAVLPATDGLRRYRGAPGMAIHNYFATLHGRRILGGKSSWIPPSTELFYAAAQRMPSETSLRILQLLGIEYLVVHASDYAPARGATITQALDARPDAWRRVFQAGSERVYQRVAREDPALAPMSTPPLPPGLKRVESRRIEAQASRDATRARRAIDDRLDTFWGTRRNQQPGDWFEFSLKTPARVAAIELVGYDNVFDAPAAFRLEAFGDDGVAHPIMERPRLRIFRDQVHRPRQFVFRVTWPNPASVRKLRITLREGVPGRWWTIHEARLWSAPG
jgi:hypothetical protein